MAHQKECHFAHEITSANALPNEIPDETVALPLLMFRFLSGVRKLARPQIEGAKPQSDEARISAPGGFVAGVEPSWRRFSCGQDLLPLRRSFRRCRRSGARDAGMPRWPRADGCRGNQATAVR